MSAEVPTRHQGKIKFYNYTYRYGFIVPDNGDASRENDIFVHKSAIHKRGMKSPHPNEPVTYELLVDDKNRVYATNVERPEAQAFVPHERKKKSPKPEADSKEEAKNTPKSTEQKSWKKKRNSNKKRTNKPAAEGAEQSSEATTETAATTDSSQKPKYRSQRQRKMKKPAASEASAEQVSVASSA